MRFSLSALAFVLFTAATLAADPETEPGGGKLTDKEVAVAKKALDAHLGKLNANNAQVAQVTDESVLKAMPAVALYSVRFRQFPVAFAPPEGLRSSNVLAVGRDAKVHVLTTITELEKYLKTSLPAADSEAKIKDVARLAARLGQEFYQDGFYKFTLMDEATKVTQGRNGKSATAKFVVMSGGNGTYVVNLEFTAVGKLASLKEIAMIRPGPRPRCQATKLLDSDPIVRTMAEEALLSMGRGSKDYIDEQRAKAPPELRKAIDAMWKKICEQDR